MNALVLLLTIATYTLMLRSGDRIRVDGPVTEENGVVTFRMNGLLYSMPSTEIETRLTAAEPASREAEEKKRLKVSAEERDRLLRELEGNHAGTPAPSTQTVPPAPPPPSAAEVKEKTGEEWEWRQMARDHEERIRRATEDLQLLEERIERLRHEIRGFTSLGYKPSQFTYQATQLQHAIEALPYQQLELTRAERAFAQFREDARRQGVLPGWLR